MCRALKVNRSTTYYRPDGKKKLAEAARHEKDLQDVKEAFEEGKENYGARQIKTSLAGKGIVMSRRKSCRLMKELGLVSAYGIPKYTKPGTKSAGTNKADVSNLLGRNFSTDRGMEFCAAKIDEFLDRHGIIRSLSRPRTPIDNAVAESFYKTVKKEFVRKREFPSLENLRLLFGDWVHWYNNIRFHSANGNKSPVTYRLENTMAPLKKVA